MLGQLGGGVDVVGITTIMLSHTVEVERSQGEHEVRGLDLIAVGIVVGLDVVGSLVQVGEDIPNGLGPSAVLGVSRVVGEDIVGIAVGAVAGVVNQLADDVAANALHAAVVDRLQAGAQVQINLVTADIPAVNESANLVTHEGLIEVANDHEAVGSANVFDQEGIAVLIHVESDVFTLNSNP